MEGISSVREMSVEYKNSYTGKLKKLNLVHDGVKLS